MSARRPAPTSRKQPQQRIVARKWKVHVSIESRALRVSAATVKATTVKILKLLEAEISPKHINELHVLFINDAKMREINFEFRSKDKPTDVLSFPQFTPRQIRGDLAAPESSGTYLGDLVVSTETTLRQAKRFGVTPRAELIRLLVHGLLHLCGYDHEKVSATEAQRMRRRERAIRKELLENGSPK
jgi:probable rRNA maturation factor